MGFGEVDLLGEMGWGGLMFVMWLGYGMWKFNDEDFGMSKCLLDFLLV